MNALEYGKTRKFYRSISITVNYNQSHQRLLPAESASLLFSFIIQWNLTLIFRPCPTQSCKELSCPWGCSDYFCCINNEAIMSSFIILKVENIHFLASSNSKGIAEGWDTQQNACSINVLFVSNLIRVLFKS